MPVATPATRALWLLALPVLAFFVLAWPAVHGPFVFDDFPNLAALAKTGAVDSWRALGIYLSESRYFPGRPLAMLSFLPQQASWPGDPLPFKVVNLLLHGANALLLWALLRRVTAAVMTPDRSRLVAALAAVAWLVHPMQLSTVFLVVQRMTLLATFFVLLGLLAYVHALLATGWSQRARVALMALGVVGGTGLAVLCKESGALLPLFALVLDATVLRDAAQALPRPLQRWRRLLVGVPVALLAAFLLWQLTKVGEPMSYRGYTLGERMLTQGRVLVDYVGKIAFPRYASYSIFHDDFVASRGLLAPASTLPTLLAVLAALGAAIGLRRRAPWFAFGVLWFLAGHAMEAGPLPLELYFEHRNYLPMAGLIAAAAAGLTGLPEGGARRIFGLLAGVWLLLCLLATSLYAQVWASPTRLSSFWAGAHPDSVRAQTYLAQVLFEGGNPGMSRTVVARLAQRRPDDAAPRLTLAFIDCRGGTLKRADVDALAGRLATTQWSRGTIQAMGELRGLVSARACPDALDDAAWLRLSDRLLANPVFGGATSRGPLHYQRHELAVARGDLARAIAELDATAAVEPDPEIARLQAKYLFDAGLTADAIARLEHYDGSRRPLLRRLLVDDAAINREAVATLRARAAAPH
jgi:hypothetical protein